MLENDYIHILYRRGVYQYLAEYKGIYYFVDTIANKGEMDSRLEYFLKWSYFEEVSTEVSKTEFQKVCKIVENLLIKFQDEQNLKKPTVEITAIVAENSEWFIDFIPDEFLLETADINRMYLGILLGDTAIGSTVLMLLDNQIYIQWIYIAPDYRRFQYGSHVLRSIIERMPEMQCSQIIAQCRDNGDKSKGIEKFFLENGFIDNPTSILFKKYQLNDIYSFSGFQKIKEKKISERILPISQIEDKAIMLWNQTHLPVIRETDMENHSFFYVKNGKAEALLLGSKENEKIFVLEYLYAENTNSSILLDLILAFIDAVKRDGSDDCTVMVMIDDSRIEQMAVKLFGENPKLEKFIVHSFEYYSNLSFKTDINQVNNL